MLRNIWNWYDSSVYYIDWLSECVKIYDWEDRLTLDEILKYYDATNKVRRIIESSNIWDRVSVLELNKDWLWVISDISTKRPRVVAHVTYVSWKSWYDVLDATIWLIKVSNIVDCIKALLLNSLARPNIKKVDTNNWKFIITDLWSSVRRFVHEYDSLTITSWNPQ